MPHVNATFEAANKLKHNSTWCESEGPGGGPASFPPLTAEKTSRPTQEVKSCKRQITVFAITLPLTRQFIPGLRGAKHPEPARRFGLASEGNKEAMNKNNKGQKNKCRCLVARRQHETAEFNLHTFILVSFSHRRPCRLFPFFSSASRLSPPAGVRGQRGDKELKLDPLCLSVGLSGNTV